MVDDDVLGLDRGEAIAAMLAHALGKPRSEGREFEIGPVLLVKEVDVGDSEQAGLGRDQGMLRIQTFADEAVELVRHLALELEADDSSSAASLDRASEVADQILGFFLDLDIAVADHPEGAAGDQRMFRKDGSDHAADQSLDRHVARRLARDPDEARKGRGHHQKLADRLSVRAPPEIEDQGKALVRDEREWMGRIERLRCENREDLLAEMAIEPGLRIAVERLLAENRHLRLGKRLAEIDPNLLLAVGQPVGFLDDRGQLLGRGQPVGAMLLDVEQLLALESGDPDHEEFIEIGARDGQEAKPLEQGVGRIAGFLEHAPVEGEPAQLPVEVTLSGRGRQLPLGRVIGRRWRNLSHYKGPNPARPRP